MQTKKSLLIAITLCCLNTQICFAENSKQHGDPTTNGLPAGRVLKQIAQRLKQNGLSSLPSAATVVEQSKNPIKRVGSKEVSGTPPTLSSLATHSVKNVFWRPGVIDAIGNGTATPEQCNEFFGSDVDNESAGLGACYMTSDVGQAFETILSADIPRCYLQRMPTQENLDAGAVVLNKGTFPNNDITQTFSVGNRPRLIKVNVGRLEKGQEKEDIFIRVSSSAENKSADLDYKAELYFCGDGESQAHGYNIIQVGTDGKYSFYAANAENPFGGGTDTFSVEGYLERSGLKTGWDEDLSRTATVQYVEGTDFFKGEFEITPDDEIILKSKSGFEDEVLNDYTISSFHGRSVKEATFFEGAYKGTSDSSDFDFGYLGSAEYRDNFYAYAPENDILDDVSSYDIASDPFYNSLPNPQVDTSQYSCTAEPDLVLTMKDNDTLDESLKPCFRNRFPDMEFCSNDPDVNKASDNYQTSCPQ